MDTNGMESAQQRNAFIVAIFHGIISRRSLVY